jgi:hypothetical protein
MFNKATLIIRSLKNADQFRYYAARVGDRIGSICKLIKVPEVYQPYSSLQSLADLA